MNKSSKSFFTELLIFKKIVFNKTSYFSDRINKDIDNLATYFVQNKSSTSPFIHLFAHNHIKTIIAFFAIQRSNHICVLIDPDIKNSEHEELIQDTPPFAVVNFNKETDFFHFQSEIYLYCNKNNSNTKTQLKDVCTIVYTAAYDGFLKGAMLTYTNLFSNTNAIITCDNITKDSTCCALAPFSHLYGFQMGVLAPILSGASLIIEDISNLKYVKTSIQNIAKYNITNIYSVPMIYYLMCKFPEINTILKSVKTFASGGYTLSKNIFKNFLQKTGKNIHNGYGLTEASPVCAWQRPDDIFKQNSVGKPFTCCEIVIRNNFEINLPIDTIGEIHVKGDNVMKGYYNHEKTTVKTILNGWLKTGDLGKIDNEGCVYITGLKKNMFNIGGRNVYPEEILRIMKQHRNIIDISFNSNISEIQGNSYTANIKLKNNNYENQELFKKHCKENMSQFKIPKAVTFH